MHRSEKNHLQWDYPSLHKGFATIGKEGSSKQEYGGNATARGLTTAQPWGLSAGKGEGLLNKKPSKTGTETLNAPYFMSPLPFNDQFKIPMRLFSCISNLIGKSHFPTIPPQNTIFGPYTLKTITYFLSHF